MANPMGLVPDPKTTNKKSKNDPKNILTPGQPPPAAYYVIIGGIQVPAEEVLQLLRFVGIPIRQEGEKR